MKKLSIGELKRKLSEKPLSRSIEFTRADDGREIDQEARRVPVCFSTENPVETWFGMEVLDHSKKSVRMGRLENNAPVLTMHNRHDHVGVVEDATIDGDRRGRAWLRFGTSARSSEVFQDIVDGIRTKVSVGYRIYDIVLESEKDGVPTYRVMDWEPTEISIVSIEADVESGVGRSLDETLKGDEMKVKTGEQKRSEEQAAAAPEAGSESSRAAPAAQPAAPAVHASPVDVAQERANARRAELDRVRGINEISNDEELARMVPNIRELAQKHIDEELTVDSMRQAVLSQIREKRNSKENKVLGMDAADVNKYSLVRALAAVAYPNDSSIQKRAAYELDVSRMASEGADVDYEGLCIPVDVTSAMRMPLRNFSGQRDLNVGTATAGGNLVQTEVDAASLIDLLRNRMAVMGAGATMLGNLVGNLSIPALSAGATAYWFAEGGAPTESQQTIGSVPLTPHNVGAFTDMTRNLLLQSSLDVEMLVRNDLVQTLALAIDLAALYGSGAAGQPTGLANIAGVGSVAFTVAGQPDWGEVVDLEADIEDSNAAQLGASYLMRGSMQGYLKQTEKAAGYPRYLMEENGTLNGSPARVSNQVTAGDLWYGAWSDLIIGMWGGLDILRDPFTNSTTMGVRLVSMALTDVNARHAASFSLGQ